MADRSLDDLRNAIDRIDSQLLNLISERAQCAKEVAEVKVAEGATEFYRPEREAQVLRKIMDANEGPLDNEEMARLFREIMSACLALEKPVMVAFLGPEGTFTQEAALKHFGHSAVCLPMFAIDEVFREVQAGAANYGVVPIENSTEGVVNHTLDSFIDASLKICGEVELRIHQNFLVGPNTDPNKITRVYSHPQSLAQCRKWLDSHYPQIDRIPVSSNAEAAKMVQGEWNSAAIAGDMAVTLYGLTKLREKIEDRPDNSTRFLVVGSKELEPSGDDKTSIMVAMKNEPGALYTLLEPLRAHDIDMTRLESRPSPVGKWNYLFFIDFRGHRDEANICKALDEIRDRCSDLKVLGSYPRAVL